MSVEPLKESHQNPSFQKSKNPNPSFGFLETRGICSKSKKTQNSSSFQKSKNPKIQKPQPQFRIFGNSRNLLKIQKNQNSSSFQKPKNPKIPTPVSDFWKLEEFAQNPKKTQNSSSFQKSKNPKIPTPVSDFWKLGEFWIFLDFEQILEFPKIRNWGWDFWIFGFLETRGILGFLDFEQIPRVSKNPKLGLGVLDFWNFGNSRNFGFFWISRLPLEFPKIRNWGWDFWIFGSRNFGFFWILSKFLEFPKIRNWGWDFWIFGFLETRGILGFFWILSKFLEFPKIRNLGWDFWIFGFLETRGILEWCSSPPPRFLDRSEIQFRGLSRGGGG